MNTRTILTFACAGLFAVAAISAPVGVTVNGIALDDAGLTNAGWACRTYANTFRGGSLRFQAPTRRAMCKSLFRRAWRMKSRFRT